MKKLTGITFFLIFCFSLAFLNASTPSIEKSNNYFSSSNSSDRFSDLSFSHPNSEIEISNIHGSTSSQGTHGFQKIVSFLSAVTRNVCVNTAFSSTDNSLPGYLLIKKYLSHIYPFHNFW